MNLTKLEIVFLRGYKAPRRNEKTLKKLYFPTYLPTTLSQLQNYIYLPGFAKVRISANSFLPIRQPEIEV